MSIDTDSPDFGAALDAWIERGPDIDGGPECCPACGGPLDDDEGCPACARYDEHVDAQIDELKEDR